MKSNNHGGSRDGSGRPTRSAPKQKGIWCGQITDEQRERIIKSLTPEERFAAMLDAVEKKNEHADTTKYRDGMYIVDSACALGLRALGADVKTVRYGEGTREIMIHSEFVKYMGLLRYVVDDYTQQDIYLFKGM